MKKSNILSGLCLILILALNINSAIGQDVNESKVTITLLDKNDVPLQNLPFDLLNPDNSLRAQAITDSLGEFKTMLGKGKSYIVFFKDQDKEWNFSVDVPDKPGRRAYKYSFKIYLKEIREVGYKSTSDFDVKGDPTICEVKISIRDQSGMMLPSQPFTLTTKDKSIDKVLVTDSSGIYKITLKKEKRYDLMSEIEGYKFTTYFEIAKDLDFMNFVFDVDFDKVTHTFVDTTSFEKIPKRKRDVNTIIRVVNKQGKVEEDAEVILEESNKRVFAGMTEEEGEVNTITDRVKVYNVFVRKEGKTFVYEMILPEDTTISEYTFIAEVNFDRLPKRKFRLNAYFDTGKWDLRPESFPDLNMLLKLMTDNLKMIIEVEGHTDSRDTEKRNQVLSENRAKSIQDWLVERGIDGTRVTHIGYGENMPCATNNTEPGRQLNRRIEVSVMDE